MGLAARLSRFRRRLVYSAVAAVMLFTGFLAFRPRASSGGDRPVDELMAQIDGIIDQVCEWVGIPRQQPPVMGAVPTRLMGDVCIQPVKE